MEAQMERTKQEPSPLNQVINDGKIKIEVYQRERFVKSTYANQQNMHLNNSIRFADAKAGALVAANGIVSKFITDVSPDGYSLADWSFKIGLFIVCIGIFLAILVVFPKRLNPKEKGIMYWEHIANYKKEEYVTAVDEMPVQDLLAQSSQNNYDQAVIVTEKFKKLERAFLASTVGYVFIFIAILMRVF